MMTKLVEKVTNLVKEEYESATIKFGAKHNSSHEAVAVICEEIHEAQDENNVVQKTLLDFWSCVRKNASKEEQDNILNNMRESAILCACEMIQVAAMAHKALQGYTIEEQFIPYEPEFPVTASFNNEFTPCPLDFIRKKDGETE